MSKITRDEIIKAITTLLETNEDSSFNYLIQGYDDDLDLFKGKHSGLTFEHVEQVGGEGKGDHCHLVIKVKKGKDFVHFKIDGYHNSYDGCNYDSSDDIYLVESYMKEVRDWRKI